jgi:trigger factor
VSEISAAVKIEDTSPVKKKISFNIPWADVKSELDTVYRKLGKTAKVKGFRPGRIPRSILERYYREQAEEDTVSNIVKRYYWETLKNNEIPAVTQPEIEQKGIEAEKDFTFSATIEVEPAIEPEGYLGLQLQKEEPVVTDEDLELRLREISQMFATMEDMNEDRGVVAGDFVNLDFSGSIAGKPLKELTAENYLLEIGSKSFVPGFEDQLIGMKQREARSISVRFPETYHASHLAGKEVDFKVNVKGIRNKRVPEIDENFIRNFEKYESLEALRDDVRKDLKEEKQRKIDVEFDRSIGEKLLACNNFEVPESFIERQIYYMMSDTQRRMVSGGMDPKKAAEFSFKLHDQFRVEAIKIVKTILLIKNIARKEAITVGEDEVEKRISEIAAQKAQDFDALKKSLEKDDLIENIKSEILSQKTYEFIVAKATVNTIRTEKSTILEEVK